MISWIVAVLLKLVKLERLLKGVGEEPLKQEDLKKPSSLSLKRIRSDHFYQNASGIIRSKS